MTRSRNLTLAALAIALMVPAVAAGIAPAGATSGPDITILSVGKAKLNRQYGTASLPVTLGLGGELKLVGTRQVKPVSRTIPSASTVNLKVVSRGKALKKLNRTGSVCVRIIVSFKATDGSGGRTSSCLKLKKRIRR